MKRYHIILLVLLIFFTGIGILEYSQGTVSESVFDQVTYKYKSHVWIPPSTPNGSSLGGFYNITGKGRDFKFYLVLPGAEEGESPLDYTKDGLEGTGHIDEIQVNFNTIWFLMNRDLKKAMFATNFKGNMNMTCAAWNGSSQFTNNGKEFKGTFFIDGVMTDWEGNYTLKEDGNRIALLAQYLWWHGNKTPESVHYVEHTYYL